MKGKSYFGYKFLLFIALVVAIAHAGARNYKGPYDYYSPDPTDSNKNNHNRVDSLHFPLDDRMGSPAVDPKGNGMDLRDPSNVKKSVEYDPATNEYFLTEKIGDQFFRTPATMTLDEFLKYQAQQDEQAYWKRRMDALTLFNKKPELPTMYKEGIFDRIFGGTTISVRPQGNVDVTFGGNWQNIKNPTLVQRAQKYGVFDFDMQMNINLLATVGDKLKLNISNNTKATFDYQNVQKLEYTGKEDEIIKKIEAGNISFPLKSSLITGVQSLFGIKTQLQFGKLWVTGVLSQQKSKRSSVTVQGGAQTQQFNIKADDYEENRHFLLAQYFHDNYNGALKNFPVINSEININKVEVWVTNRTGATDGVRSILAFMDLGEKTPYKTTLTNATGSDKPDNRSNSLYDQLVQNPRSRDPLNYTSALTAIGLGNDDYQVVTARKLQPSEFTFSPNLGYISVNYSMNPDDILAVAYQYTFRGKTYKVGEFAEDLPPDTTNQKIMFMKLLKGTSARPTLPIWKLMMKNVYALGGVGLSKEDFKLNVLYQDPKGGEKRYIPEGPNAGVPLITLLNLDRLNSQNDPVPDGVFDYVEGITINSQTGKVIFPVLEPFGDDLAGALGNNQQLERKYLYTILYDSTKTIARQFPQNNRYIMRGSYKSSSSSEIFLGGFNIPQGSVTVTAGGQRLVENIDYQIDYGLGRIKILNSGIMSSGIPINIQYEDNATFGFQQQNFMGARLDYYLNKKLTLGGTYMRLTERPFTQKTNFGDDPIKNTVLGLDANYQSEFPGLTRALDKLPVYSTTASSFITASGEVAGLLPSHPKQIDALDPEGSVYIDDFEGTKSSYDLKSPAIAWSLASTPYDARNKNNQLLFPEAEDNNDLKYGYNRALLAWYTIEPTLVDPTGGVPDFVKKDPMQHYIRLVQKQEVFPNTSYTTLQNALSTFDLGYYPKERGPYNFVSTASDVNTDGTLKNPQIRWGGIQRPIDYTDFEAANVEFIEFWMMDPFINNQNNAGSLYINLGNVSEDVLKDGSKAFENGITAPKDPTKLTSTVWGFQPQFQQQITRAFDNDPATRAIQDVGYDGLSSQEEGGRYQGFLNQVAGVLGATSSAYQKLSADPSSDDYHYYRGSDYDNANVGVLGRYKLYNNSEGNSPITDANSAYSSAATTIPESEDINKDNTLNTSEEYYQYRVDLKPNMIVGENYVVSKQVSSVKLPNGNYENETWYQFKVPIQSYDHKVGGIADFRSIRFIRMFLNNFQDSVILRFAQLDLGRNQWRQYLFSLQSPGENIPDADAKSTAVTVASVSVEENANRQPIPYVIPPGVNRQQQAVSNGQNVQLNEQALSFQVCALKDGDARAVYKEVNVDMRQFNNLRMFIHAESQVGQPQLVDGDLRAIIRMGSDFTNNYYEYEIPLKITVPAGAGISPDDVWPVENRMDILLNDLVNVKTNRNNKGLQSYVPYSEQDSKGNTIVVVGNPNIGDSKTILMGVMNPKKTTQTPNDDGQAKCVEVWFNELRMAGMNESAGYAATGKVNLQMADLGTLRLSGSMHTAGYGSIDQKIQQRSRDNFYQYDASTNLNMGKLMPKKWGVQLPLFAGYSESISNPVYNPYDQDVKMTDQLAHAVSNNQKDSLRKAAQDFTSITSINLTNVRIMGNPEKQSAKKMPWSIQNFDLSYAYNRQFKRNPTIESDNLTNNKLGLGYTYSVKSKSLEPFKKMIKSRSRWYSVIKDFNINPLPSNFTFRSELNRVMEATQVRNVYNDGSYGIPATYFKNFTWARSYALRWELTKSLSFDYSATNNSRIDEPYGPLDTKEKRDTVWTKLLNFGRNTLFTQAFNTSYNVPLQKIPITDWMNLRFTYGSTYSWTAASELARTLGNTIGNTQSKQINSDLNFTQLWNKNRWLKAINQPKPRTPGKELSKPGQANSPFGTKSGGNSPDVARVGDGTKGDGGKGGDSKSGSSSGDSSKTKKLPPNTVVLNGVTINTASMSDHQLDSLNKLLKAQEEARLKAEKEKRKRDRIAARKARRAATPEISGVARFIGRVLTMLKRTTFNYTENGGTILPGYMDSTQALGMNWRNDMQPGANFVFGYQPNSAWLESKAYKGLLSRDSIFNSQYQQRYSQTMNVNATVEPFPDFRVDISLTKSFTKAHNELFKDTGTGTFVHLSPYENGSYNISYIAIKTMFKPSGANSSVYNEFLENRKVISDRLGKANPYTNNVPDPNNPNYTKGYTEFSQDVLIPAFIAAYTGKSASSVPLLNYDNSSIKTNPFKYYYPMPNWRVQYNGLTKLPMFQPIFTNFVLNHAYSGTLAVNTFSTALFYQDVYNIGFPSFIDSASGNYVPFFQVPNITISEQFSPLLGFDASLRNGMTARFEFRKSRTVALSLIDYQVSETKSSEFVIGGGYRVKGLILPFAIFGVKKLKNDLNIKLDLGLRDDKTSNSYLAQNIDITTRGQKTITISPSVDYIVSDKLTLRFFYDRRQSIPYISSAYPTTTTKAGVTLRFIFAN
ncbi:T9SS outer membrane translocon Sov/SprA [Taibaiella soli]|uniref:Cell surface protein SprA n=1 Tax=Taibaiella soli TaxID=1649169 RepID=A0A2W2BA45_9BACT|nr:cell surface protein SprA [Taibaiella soli]PZF73119.1 cell surface protein SprA [Taibaiella soli]